MPLVLLQACTCHDGRSFFFKLRHVLTITTTLYIINICVVSEYQNRLWIDAFITFQMLLYGRTQDVWTRCCSKGDTCEPVLQYIPIVQIVISQNSLGIPITFLNNDLKKRFYHMSCDAKSSETVSEKNVE